MNHFPHIHLPRAGVTALVLLIALLAAGCASSVQANPAPTLQPTQPTPAPTLAPTPTPAPTLDPKTQAEQAAADMLAKTLGVPVGDVKLTDIQPVQWPDSCLGVPQAGILCAMHVVDGYRLTLAAQGQAYEAHSNLDGSQVVLVPGPLPPATGITFNVRQGASCTSYIFHPDQGVIYGQCGASQKTVRFVDSLQKQALQHYLTTYQSFTADLPQGFVNFAGSGSVRANAIEQRSIAAWAEITASEARAGRSSAADGLVIGWHRQGGLAGFCDDLSVYETGMVSATACTNGIAQNMGISWLTTDQLTQLYHWLDRLAHFEYAPPTVPGPDAINIDLIFSGKGSAKPSATDQQDIESFAEVLEANLTSAAVPSNLDQASKVVTDFLTAYQTDPTGAASQNYLSAPLLADLKSGDQLSTLLGIQNNYRGFAITSSQAVPGSDQVMVDATFNFVSPIRRSFVVSWEEGGWRIDTFIVRAVPPTAPDRSFMEPDMLLLQFVQDLQDRDASGAFALLTPAEQASYPLSLLESTINGLTGLTPLSITLTDATALDKLTYTVTLWALTGDTPPAGWLPGQNIYTFSLTQTLDGWRIDGITPLTK